MKDPINELAKRGYAKFMGVLLILALGCGALGGLTGWATFTTVFLGLLYAAVTGTAFYLIWRRKAREGALSAAAPTRHRTRGRALVVLAFALLIPVAAVAFYALYVRWGFVPETMGSPSYYGTVTNLFLACVVPGGLLGELMYRRFRELPSSL